MLLNFQHVQMVWNMPQEADHVASPGSKFCQREASVDVPGPNLRVDIGPEGYSHGLTVVSAGVVDLGQVT